MTIDRQRTLEKLEAAYGALPPFNSQTYLHHVEGAPKEQLPAEVLARAYRENLQRERVAAPTLARLFRQTGQRFEYLKMLQHKIRILPITCEDRKDRLMDGVLRMLTTLPTSQGKRAETGWNRFTWQEALQAWRALGFRKGRRTYQEEATIANHPIWESPVFQVITTDANLEIVERVIGKVLAELEDPFVQAVAKVAWTQTRRPKVSGKDSLVDLFSGKSRYQILRALEKADRRLAKALLAEPTLRLHEMNEAWLQSLASKGANHE